MPETALENDSGLSPSLPRGHNIIGPKKTVYPFPAGSRAGHLAGGSRGTDNQPLQKLDQRAPNGIFTSNHLMAITSGWRGTTIPLSHSLPLALLLHGFF